MNVINICEFVDSSKWKRNIWKFIVEDLLLTEKNQEVKAKKIKSNYYCKKYNCSVNIKMILKIKIILNNFIIKWAMEIIKIH